MLSFMFIAPWLDYFTPRIPDRWHPVAWLGSLIALLYQPAPKNGAKRQFSYGAVAVILVCVLVGAGIQYAGYGLSYVSTYLAFAFGLLVFLSSFTVWGLTKAARRVRDDLKRGDLDAARRSARALVGRDTSKLTQEQIVSATVESIAENSCDSFVAPWFYALIFRVPGAAVYRVVNTFDAMAGHHGFYEHLGKFAARLDDVLNYIPSRLSALLIVACSFGRSKSPYWSGGPDTITYRYITRKSAWRIMVRDHHLTESPNSGWTMSAMAGALGVRLEKPGCYALGDADSSLTVDKIDAAIYLFGNQAVCWGVFCLIVEVARGYITQTLAG